MKAFVVEMAAAVAAVSPVQNLTLKNPKESPFYSRFLQI